MSINEVLRTSGAGQRAYIRLLFTAVIAAGLASCAVSLPRTAFTEKEQSIAQIPGMPNVRFYTDAPLPEILRALEESSMLAAADRSGGFNMLAISGGAWDGAYGAGIINGWTGTGTRPEFTAVTGVSAGSLIAPFAFLGPDYDGTLRDSLTSGAAEPIGDGTDSVLSVIGEAGERRDALHALVARYVDAKVLRAVAAAHKRGRRLLVVTTNLDAQRAVVWNMGAIAASGSPHALELFRDVLTASCSVPGMFEPTRITVTAAGRRFEELHVDGGVTTNVFMLPDAVLTAGGDRSKLHGSMYVIMNTRLTPEFEVTGAELPATLGRSISTLIKAHTKATVMASIEFSRSTGIDFNMTHIDMPPPQDVKPGFNTEYMRALYAIGYRRARAGGFWQKTMMMPAGYRQGVPRRRL
jgi:hypothetical protein